MFIKRQTAACATFALPLLCLTAAAAPAKDLPAVVARELPGLVTTYEGIHAHPELSHHEEHAAALLASELRNAGYTVTERVGKYRDGTQAYGVVAVLENGAGPRLLIRTDMDALPIVEETGMRYASRVKAKNAAGQEIGVMHACGHDVHVSTMIGTAQALAVSRSQ
jgi:hippurate hydrolase